MSAHLTFHPALPPSVFSVAAAGANPNAGAPVGRQRLPTDPIGNTVVTFKGVQAGSEIRVYAPDQTEVAGVESCSADHQLVWPAYAVGNPNNTVRIVILRLDLKIKEFIYESSVGLQNLPVQQEPDKWHSNP